MSPTGLPPCACRYWFIKTVSAAQIGAAWEVPPPSLGFCSNTIRTPVNGSATAAMSGTRRWVESRPALNARWYPGRANNLEAPPLLPWDIGTSVQACSAIHRPCRSVDRVVPPTEVISGSDETASTPTSSAPGGDEKSLPPLHSSPAVSPLPSKTAVPWPWALVSADRIGARSAALTSASHPQAIDRL